MITSSNEQATKMVNITNELEKIGIEYYNFVDGYYSHQPKIDRIRLRLMKQDIELAHANEKEEEKEKEVKLMAAMKKAEEE
jgi:hypothetical protein